MDVTKNAKVVAVIFDRLTPERRLENVPHPSGVSCKIHGVPLEKLLHEYAKVVAQVFD